MSKSDKPDCFCLEIFLGNSVMQTRRHLVQAIRKVAAKIESNGYPMDESLSSEVMDINGNTVGEWELKKYQK